MYDEQAVGVVGVDLSAAQCLAICGFIPERIVLHEGIQRRFERNGKTDLVQAEARVIAELRKLFLTTCRIDEPRASKFLEEQIAFERDASKRLRAAKQRDAARKVKG